MRLNIKSLSLHLRFRQVDAHKKEKLSDEEVETEVFVDGVAVTLQTSEEAEGKEADGQADQRHGDAHPGDDGEKKLMHAALPLQKHTQSIDRASHAHLPSPQEAFKHITA